MGVSLKKEKMRKKTEETNTQTIYPFTKSNLFFNFNFEDLEIFTEFLQEKVISKDEVIVVEGDISNEIYIIAEGSLLVFRETDETDEHKELTTLKEGETFGEIAYLDKKPRSASLRALEETTLFIATEENLKKLSQSHPEYYLKFMKNIARSLGRRLKILNDTVLEDYRQQLKEIKERFFMSKFVTLLLVLICIYVMALDFSQKIVNKSPAGAFVSLSILFISVILILGFMLKSGYPMSYFGFTTKEWKRSLWEGVALTIPFMFIILVAKWIIIKEYQLEEPLFNFYAPIKKGIEVDNPIRFILTLQVLYIISVLTQEICLRAGIHSALRVVLVGKNKEWKAIFLSNLLFAGSHLIISVTFAFLVFLPGIFWGWLYSRTNNFLAPFISHALVGYWALFVVGIQHAFKIT